MTKRGGTPPVEYRFKKGASGNPKGRPSGSGPIRRRASAFDVISEPVTIRLGTTTKVMSAEDALAMKAWHQAVNGDKRAWAEVLDMVIAREKACGPVSTQARLPKIQIEHPDADNANEAMLLLGLAVYSTNAAVAGSDDEDRRPRLLLEPRAVELALNRRAVIKLSDSDRTLIRNSTKDPETISWPPRFRHDD